MVQSIVNIQGVVGITGGGGVVPVTPPPVTAGLAVYLDASQIQGLSDTDPVATWPDLSGFGRDATQATEGLQPTYHTAVQNGLPVVRFDGTDDVIGTIDFSLAPSLTYFLVARRSSGPLINTTFSDGTTTSQTLVISGWATGNVWRFVGPTIIPTAELVDAVVHLFAVELNAAPSSDQIFSIDGIRTTVNNTGNPNTPGGFQLGRRQDTFQAMAQDSSEALIYDRLLTTQEREDTEAYLQAKWGTPALP